MVTPRLSMNDHTAKGKKQKHNSKKKEKHGKYAGSASHTRGLADCVSQMTVPCLTQ